MVAAACLALAGCGDGDDAGSYAPSATTPAAGDGSKDGGRASREVTPRQHGIAIETGSSDFGTILFDEGERAIYVFDAEQSARPECYGECAVVWPPVLTEGEPRAEAGVDAKLLGTTERDGGASQVTYGGRPLYYYVDDPPGAVLCHGVAEFGGLWLVVEPGGDPAAT